MSDLWRERLRNAVDRTGKKHAFIAEEAGIDPTTLSRILTGKMRNPGFLSVVRIAHAAGESIGWILGEYGYTISEEERDRLRDAAAALIDVTSVGRVARGSAHMKEKRTEGGRE